MEERALPRGVPRTDDGQDGARLQRRLGEPAPVMVATHQPEEDGPRLHLTRVRRETEDALVGRQHHPEASPGPQDSHHLFERFVASLER